MLISVGSDSSDIAKYAIKVSNTVSGNLSAMIIPVLKDDKFWVFYSFQGTTNVFKFIYALGSEPQS